MISTRPSTRYFFSRNRLNRVTTASFCAIMLALAVVAAGCGGSSSHHYQPHHFSFTTDQSIWVANGSDVLEFTNFFTSRTPNIAPETIITNSAGFNSTQGVLFDSVGDLWVIDGGALATSSTGDAFPALEEFTAAQIVGGGPLNLTPAVTITNTNDSGATTPFGFPQQAIFDSTGNMWVTDTSTGSVDVYLADQLTTSGDTAPFGQLTTTGAGGLSGPLGVALDSSGNLWIANNSDTSIFEYDNAIVESLITTGGVEDVSPNIVLNNTQTSIEGPWALLFDFSGNLWSSNANSPFTVVAFSPTSLEATGTPTPEVTFNPVNVKGVQSLNSPNGLAFDTGGNLAVANSAAPFSIAIFAADQLGDSGNTKPEVLISGSNTGLVAPAGDAFGPQ